MIQIVKRRQETLRYEGRRQEAISGTRGLYPVGQGSQRAKIMFLTDK
jgi:hypothetical protein